MATTFYTDRASISLNGLPYSNTDNIKSVRFTANDNTNFSHGFSGNRTASGFTKGNSEHEVTIEEMIPNSGTLIDWSVYDYETNSVQITVSSSSSSYANPAEYNGASFIFSRVAYSNEDVGFSGQGSEATRSTTFKACDRSVIS